MINVVVLAEIAPRFPTIEELRSALPSVVMVEDIPWLRPFWLVTRMPIIDARAEPARPFYPTS